MFSPMRARALVRARPACALPPAFLPSPVLLRAVPARPFSLLTRTSGFLFERDPPPAPVLRKLESVANRSPGDASWQLVYLQALF